jgi:Holliday junction resolvasome RuvABC endonuclease subunit
VKIIIADFNKEAFLINFQVIISVHMISSSSKNKPLVLAVDPSLRQSGWAVFEIDQEAPLEWGVVSPEISKAPLSERLDSIHHKIELLFSRLGLSAGDYLVCEGPAPVSLNPSSAIKVEQVRSMFESIARSARLVVPGRLNPRTVQTELFGLRGRQLPRKEVKKIAEQLVSQMFSLEDHPVIQDAIDAILIGVLARSKIIHAGKTGTAVGSLFEGGRGNAALRSGRGLRWNAGNSIRN